MCAPRSIQTYGDSAAHSFDRRAGTTKNKKHSGVCQKGGIDPPIPAWMCRTSQIQGPTYLAYPHVGNCTLKEGALYIYGKVATLVH